MFLAGFLAQTPSQFWSWEGVFPYTGEMDNFSWWNVWLDFLVGGGLGAFTTYVTMKTRRPHD